MSDSVVLRRSAISGLVWAAITILLLNYAVDRSPGPLSRMVWVMRGGIIAAPLIGMAVGYTSRLFADLGVLGRAVLSLVTLYGSGVVFFLAGRAVNLMFDDPASAARTTATTLLLESIPLTFYGLTFTGFVLVLGPLAYLNHWFISRSLVRNEQLT